MGQRLVTVVYNGDEAIAAIYYHWSAYTRSAICEVSNVVSCIMEEDDKSVRDLQLRLIKFCYENGGGINGDKREFSYIENAFPNEFFKRDGYSRNNGIIAISKDGIKDLLEWAEGEASIIVDQEMVYFDVFGSYVSMDMYFEETGLTQDEVDMSDVSEIDCDISEFSFEDAEAVKNYILELPQNSNLFMYNGEVIEFI